MKYLFLFLSICFLFGCKNESKEISPVRKDSVNPNYYYRGDTLYINSQGQENMVGTIDTKRPMISGKDTFFIVSQPSVGFNDGLYDTNISVLAWDGEKWIPMKRTKN